VEITFDSNLSNYFHKGQFLHSKHIMPSTEVLNFSEMQVIEKNSSYHTLENTWTNMLNEADKVATLHTKIKDTLIADPYEKVIFAFYNV